MSFGVQLTKSRASILKIPQQHANSGNKIPFTRGNFAVFRSIFVLKSLLSTCNRTQKCCCRIRKKVSNEIQQGEQTIITFCAIFLRHSLANFFFSSFIPFPSSVSVTTDGSKLFQ